MRSCLCSGQSWPLRAVTPPWDNGLENCSERKGELSLTISSKELKISMQTMSSGRTVWRWSEFPPFVLSTYFLPYSSSIWSKNMNVLPTKNHRLSIKTSLIRSWAWFFRRHKEIGKKNDGWPRLMRQIQLLWEIASLYTHIRWNLYNWNTINWHDFIVQRWELYKFK